MKRLATFFVITVLAINSFAQITYPDPPKSTNDATIIGKLTYPYHFTYEGNPVSRMHGAADPDVQVWGDTIWVYTSQDRKMIPGVHESHYDAMDGYHVFSTTDMVNWTNHGEIMHSSDISWANGGFLWAPGSARKNGKYYLYYPVKDKQLQWKIGVAIGDTPAGPFTDTGKPIAGIGGIDPKIFIDDDGEAYIYNNSAIVAKLKPNMIELAEPTRKIVYGSNDIMNDGNLNFAEGSYMHKKDGIYYYSYSNWHNKTYQGFYAMGTSPYGPFDWKGALAPNPAGAQDHHSIVEFKGQWYYFYHIAINGLPKYKESQGRIFCFDRLYYNKDGTIQKVVHTQGPTNILKTNAPNGSVILAPPGGAYAPGTTVKVTAKSDLGYAFDSWSGDLAGSQNPATIKMDADKRVSANFTVTPTYSLSVNSAKGSVALNPSGGVYNSGDEVLLTPNKVFGYRFSSWSGDLTGSAVPGKITMNSNKSVTANYMAVPTYKITDSAKNGIIEFDPPGGFYEEGTIVTVKAKKDYGYEFSGWSGDISDTKNPVSIVMNADKSITANFIYVGNEKIVFATNCGGEAFRSEEGVYYSADSKYSGGGTYSGGQAISGTTDDILYQKERFGSSFGYKIALPNKEYKVTLMFAEIFHDSAGKRVFDVSIEGVKVSGNLDIWSKVGKNAAYNETHSVKVSDGELNISFATIKDNAKISAIKVTEAAPVTGLNQFPSNVPKRSETGQNYPNPFQSGTTIPYRLFEASHVKITIYNYLGQQIATLVNEFQNAGEYSIFWDAKNSPGKPMESGLYLYRMETGHDTFSGGKLLISNNITYQN
jgi:arabinoxylan arabinofuranohydrolase